MYNLIIDISHYVLAFHLEASREGADKIRGGIIVCALRSMPQDHAIEMAELAAKYLKVVRSRSFIIIAVMAIFIHTKDIFNQNLFFCQKQGDSLETGQLGVVGFDIAGDEGRFPLRSFTDKMAEGVKRYNI